MAESEDELNSFLRRVKEKSKKAGLNLSLKTNKQTKIMAFGPITSGKLMGKKWKRESFIFLGSKITVESDCTHDIKRHLILGRKAMTTLYNIFK